jgi:hypothetical protein
VGSQLSFDLRQQLHGHLTTAVVRSSKHLLNFERQPVADLQAACVCLHRHVVAMRVGKVSSLSLGWHYYWVEVAKGTV